MERTNTDCEKRVHGPISVPILGLQCGDYFFSTENECKLKCEKYKWCRGIRVPGCKLLTNHRTPVPGCRSTGFDWTEPQNWKNGTRNGYRCLEKVISSKPICITYRLSPSFNLKKIEYF